MKRCRLCLQNVPVAFSLFDNENAHMVESLAPSIKIEKTDKITTACCKCLLHLKRAFVFQQNIIKADKELNESLNVFIKKEAEEVEEVDETNVKCEVDDSYIETPLISENFSKCTICGIDVDSYQFINHVTQHFEDQQECDICHERCANLAEFKNHTLLKHKLEDSCNVCIDCGTTFKYKSLYNIHIKNAHISKTVNKKPKPPIKKVKISSQPTKDPLEDCNDIKSYPCEICSKVWRTESSYKKHLSGHETRKECNVCGAKIVKCNFTKHMKIHQDSPVICDLCGAKLKNTESLRGHVFYTHGTKKYKCDICNKMFISKFNLKLHNRSQHTGEKTHVCDICGKSFFALYHLNNHHKNIHLQLRPHVCKICDKGFIKKSALRSHERQHTRETPYKCEICGQGFKQNVSLRTHRKSKHNIVEPITCSCEVCGKEFSSDCALKTHMRKLH